jgi:hypothetical protein
MQVEEPIQLSRSKPFFKSSVSIFDPLFCDLAAGEGKINRDCALHRKELSISWVAKRAAG